MSERSNPTWVLALTSAAAFMIALDALVVTTALTVIRLDLDASIEGLEWVVNGYNLSFAVLLPTGAALGDRFGRRRLFATGLVLFVAASIGCALSGTVGWLIGARVVQGAGAALVMPLAMALLSVAFPGATRAKALGIFSSLTGLALIAGPVIGGAIAQGIAWRWIFWINLPIGLIAIPLILLRIRESAAQAPPRELDLRGLVLVTGAACGLVCGLMRANRVGWSSPETIATLAAGLILTLGFIAWERRANAPMMPMRFFRARAFASGNAASLLFYAAMYGTLFLLPQFLQSAQGHGPLGAGLRLLPWTATLFVVAPIAGALVNRIGERALIVGGLLLQAAGMAWVALIVAPALPDAALAVPLMIAGAGVSMAMPAAQNAVFGAVAPSEIGKASGMFNMLRFLGGAFGVAILVAGFAATGSLASPAAFGAGFTTAIEIAAVLSLAAAVAAMWLPGRRKLVLPQAEAFAGTPAAATRNAP
jgi:EmrB/QacA subfamily drug resistance transporter